MVKTLKKICGYAIFSLFMILTIRWWLSEFNKPEEIESVMNLLVELEDKDAEGVKNVLGEPKSVHREKVYSYKDNIATYDILIDKQVKSIVVTMKDKTNMSEQQLISEIGLKEDITDKKTTEVEGGKKTVIYDVGIFSKIEMKSALGDSSIETVKLVY